jgi:hypothetical protein
MSDSPDASTDDEEWAVSLEDLEEDGEAAVHEPEPIEPESPTLEGVAFVLLGVALTLVVLLAGF